MVQCSAVIIASGRASRLGDTCNQKPKCMLPFNGVPFLRYLVFWLLRNGIDEVIVTGSYDYNGWLIEEEIHNNFSSSVRFIGEEYPRSTAHSSFAGVSEVTNDHTLLLTGDNIWSVDLRKICRRHAQRDSHCSVLITTKKDVPNCGLVKADRRTGNIISLYDKDNRCPGISASTMGFYLLNTEKFLTTIDMGRDVYVERESMERLIPNAWGIVNNEFFFDFGTPNNFEFLSKNPEIITKYFGSPRSN